MTKSLYKYYLPAGADTAFDWSIGAVLVKLMVSENPWSMPSSCFKLEFVWNESVIEIFAIATIWALKHPFFQDNRHLYLMEMQ